MRSMIDTGSEIARGLLAGIGRFTTSIAVCLFASGLIAADAPTPSPLERGHLVVLKPDGFSFPDGKPVTPAADAKSMFKKSIPLGKEIQTGFHVAYPGKYNLWVHVRATAAQAKSPVLFELLIDGKLVAKGDAGNGEGSLETGGPMAAKALLAKETASDRIEPRQDEPAFYWWKPLSTELQPGDYVIRIKPSGKGLPAAMDSAFLSTCPDIRYPCASDLTVLKTGLYMRFRIDELPKSGTLSINGRYTLHTQAAWRQGPVYFGSLKQSLKKEEAGTPYSSKGFTSWYRLQDIEKIYDVGPAALRLSLSDPSARGATQFASWPHPDFILREFDWSEPTGLQYSMMMDCGDRPHLVRSLREHALQYYDWALDATGGQVFPLTRSGLLFANAAGSDPDESGKYTAKTLRLFGVNLVSRADPVNAARWYGGWNSGGHYRPETIFPSDDGAVLKRYDEMNAKLFSDKDLLENMGAFQIADEPGEIWNESLSAPLWVYEDDAKGARWRDVSGNSLLYTRRTDYENCVLEGEFQLNGSRAFGVRVAVDDAVAPQKYAALQVGRYSRNLQNNFAWWNYKDPFSTNPPTAISKFADLAAGTTYRFRVVHNRENAAIYINDQLIGQVGELPAKGGFGIYGPGTKSLLSLQIRPMRKGEELSAPKGKTPVAAVEEKKGLKDISPDETGDGGQGKTMENPTARAESNPLKQFVEEDWIPGGIPGSHEAFRSWAQSNGLSPGLFGKASWDEVFLLTLRDRVGSPGDAQRYYWSRRFAGRMTPHMFELAAKSVGRISGKPDLRRFVALSGHALYMGAKQMPLDMFELARNGEVTPGVSDAMNLSGWRWDSEQAVAFSVAPFNAGGRPAAGPRKTWPMMHCDWPRTNRSYAMLANQVKTISYFWWGPEYNITEWYWSEFKACYGDVSLTCNRAAQVDDILAEASMRAGRVAMLWSYATEYWNSADAYSDRRAAFLALGQDYYQPELVTSWQVADENALSRYDALYVLDPNVELSVQKKITEWVKAGGLLWTCANSLSLDETNQPSDFLEKLAGIERKLEFASPEKDDKLKREALNAKNAEVDKTAAAKKEDSKKPFPIVSPVKGESDFIPFHANAPPPVKASCPGAKVRATYDDGSPAWLERDVGKGRVIYLSYRAATAFTNLACRPKYIDTVWSDNGRQPLLQPLIERKIGREMFMSEPTIYGYPMSTEDGTVIPLVNTRPYPLKDLSVFLKEPKAPKSVQAFEGYKLVDLPFNYENGMAKITLKDFDGAQMIVVRRGDKPADGRIDKMKESALHSLEETDPRGVSAGAWFAGFFPEWGMAGRLPPFLKHDDWMVRRDAAESLGRLGAAEFADSILEAYVKEKDSHAASAELLSLAKLRHPRALSLALDAAKSPQPILRASAFDALRFVDFGGKIPEDVIKTAVVGINDRDLRVSQPAMNLLATLDPPSMIKAATAALASNDLKKDARNAWIDAVSSSDAVFKTWLGQGMPGGDALLFVMAGKHKDAKIAAALADRLEALDDCSPLVRQADPELTLKAFSSREKLKPRLKETMPLILEVTFRAHLGNDLEAWDQWLENRKK